MGLKLSCIHRGRLSGQAHRAASPARVIAADGSLNELPAYYPRVAVSDVLGTGSDAASFFVCNSDTLYFGELPPALPLGELLRPGQIYFVLPASMLPRPLSSADMAALAVRASAAIASASGKRDGGHRRGGVGGKKRKKVRVMPVREEEPEVAGDDAFLNEKLNEQTLGELGVLRSQSKKSDEKLAPPRLKRALSIIQEDAE